MSNVYLHSKTNNNSLIKVVLILLIPFMFYGIYKNCLCLLDDYRALIYLKPFIFIGISLLITLIIKLIYKEKFISNNLLENLIIAMIVIPNTNIIVYSVLIIILNFAREYIRFNKAIVFMILNIVIMMILKDYTFLNVYEASVAHSYSFFDLLMGKGYGGMCNTSIVLCIIAMCILCNNIIYKKGSSISAFCTYYILLTIYSFIIGKVDYSLVLNCNVIFGFIFLVPVSIYSPYSRGASYIYGVLIGILTFVSIFIDVNLGLYVSILIMNLLSYSIDNFIIGKSSKNTIDSL